MGKSGCTADPEDSSGKWSTITVTVEFRGMVRVNCQQILNLYFLKGVGYQNNSNWYE